MDLSEKRAAVGELYETHFERVARYIAVRIGDIQEAQDLAGEVFLRALRSVASYKETGAPLEAWLFKIAHNIAIDHLRKKRRRPASMPLDDTLPVPAADGIPGEGLEREQETERLRQAMKQLSEAQRRVLALRFGGMMTSEQAARVLGKSPVSVRVMQSAAVKKLRESLGGSEGK